MCLLDRYYTHGSFAKPSPEFNHHSTVLIASHGTHIKSVRFSEHPINRFTFIIHQADMQLQSGFCNVTSANIAFDRFPHGIICNVRFDVLQ